MSLPVESQILLSAARAGLIGQPIDPPAFDDEQWEAFLKLTLRHGLGPIVHRGLTRSQMPPSVLTALRVNAQANTLHSHAMGSELLRLLGRLQDSGIPAFPFKGPVLSVQAYGDATLRPFTDLDIFLHQSDVLKARDLLRADGFVLPPDFVSLSNADWSKVLESAYHITMFGGPRKCAVELHWEFSNRHSGDRVDLNGIWDRLIEVPLVQHNVPAMSAEDLLPYLCVHGTKHCWERLEWLCGLTGLVQQSPDMDWEQMLIRARFSRRERAVAFGLRLADELIGADLPASVRSRLNLVQPSVIDRVAGWMFDSSATPSIVSRHRFIISMQDSWRDRARYVWFHLAHATREDAPELPRRAVGAKDVAKRILDLSIKHSGTRRAA